jgi:prepilin-type N-terminal cleavage/methylation domain-containing protein
MRSKAAGFTLIELLIVVAMVAIAAGATAPVVAGAMTRYNITTAGQHVGSTIRAARFQAVGRNVALKVRLNFPAAGQYQIVQDADNAAVGEVQTLPSGITFSAPVDVRVGTDGRFMANANVRVTNGEAAYDRTITVTTSGRVTLQ